MYPYGILRMTYKRREQSLDRLRTVIAVVVNDKTILHSDISLSHDLHLMKTETGPLPWGTGVLRAVEGTAKRIEPVSLSVIILGSLS